MSRTESANPPGPATEATRSEDLQPPLSLQLGTVGTGVTQVLSPGRGDTSDRQSSGCGACYQTRYRCSPERRHRLFRRRRRHLWRHRGTRTTLLVRQRGEIISGVGR